VAGSRAEDWAAAAALLVEMVAEQQGKAAVANLFQDYVSHSKSAREPASQIVMKATL
jgi:hypothetical protein